jgi:pectate lyase
MRLHVSRIIPLIVVILSSASHADKQLAFPGAEGYGKYTVGGRGGAVFEVTNLNDSGQGSLRAAVEAEGPRTVVFRVSGTIDLGSNLEIVHPYLTIAGQTAPGDGITLKRYPLVISADEVIIRYIRVRLGDESGGAEDAISSRYTNNLILDHVSASWSIDETLSIYHGTNVTVQWSVISESLYESNHTKGSNHGYGGIWGSNYSTYHHNLLAHHSSRNPRFASGCGNTDYRNNVLYNWGYHSTYGGETVQQNSDAFLFCNMNMIANYQKAGPATLPGETSHRITAPWSRDKADDYGKWYLAGNVIEGNTWVSENNWLGGVQPQDGSEFLAGLKLDQPWPAMAIEQETAEEAFASVLLHAGATLPKRDSVDLRIIDEVSSEYATFEGATYETHHKVADPTRKSGIIDSQDDVGGWPELESLPAPSDSDHDGMPDEWELANQLNTNDAEDRNRVATDGYTMLEKYLSSIGRDSSDQP